MNHTTLKLSTSLKLQRTSRMTRISKSLTISLLLVTSQLFFAAQQPNDLQLSHPVRVTRQYAQDEIDPRNLLSNVDHTQNTLFVTVLNPNDNSRERIDLLNYHYAHANFPTNLPNARAILPIAGHENHASSRNQLSTDSDDEYVINHNNRQK